MKAQEDGAEKRSHRRGAFIVSFIFYYFTLSLEQTVGALTEEPDRPRGGWGMEAAGLRATCATLLPRSFCAVHPAKANTSKCEKGIESVDENRIHSVDEIEYTAVQEKKGGGT